MSRSIALWVANWQLDRLACHEITLGQLEAAATELVDLDEDLDAIAARHCADTGWTGWLQEPERT